MIVYPDPIEVVRQRLAPLGVPVVQRIANGDLEEDHPPIIYTAALPDARVNDLGDLTEYVDVTVFAPDNSVARQLALTVLSTLDTELITRLPDGTFCDWIDVVERPAVDTRLCTANTIAYPAVYRLSSRGIEIT